jgi:hypothetical protein
MDRNVDSVVAYDSYATMYDTNAKNLTALFESREFDVVDAELRAAGEIILELTDSVRFEIFPVFWPGGELACVRGRWRALRISRGGGHPLDQASSRGDSGSPNSAQSLHPTVDGAATYGGLTTTCLIGGPCS